MNRHDRFLYDIAELTSEMSRCKRAGVGAVIASSDRLQFAVGFNGPERGGPNSCRRPHEDGNCGCLHAEINALLKAGDLARDGIAYVTRRPCEYCAIALVNAGIRRVVCPVKVGPGPDLLRDAGIQVDGLR